MVFKTPQDIVDSFHEMTTSILHTIEIAKSTNALELSMVFELEKKVLFYNNKSISFSDYIRALKEDTHFIKGYIYNIPSKIKSQMELKSQLRTILNAIKSTIPIVSKQYGGILDYIKQHKEFDISPSSVINMFHVLINYARDMHMFDTIELIDGIWHDLREKIITKSINVTNYLNNKLPQMNRRTNRRNATKQTASPQMNKGTYPFGASSTRKRRRV